MQVIHPSAQRGALVFPVRLAGCIPHRHFNVQHSPAFMERNSLNIANPFFFFFFKNGLWLNHPPLTFKQEAGDSQPFNPAKSICEYRSHGSSLTGLFPDLFFFFFFFCTKKCTKDLSCRIYYCRVTKPKSSISSLASICISVYKNNIKTRER